MSVILFSRMIGPVPVEVVMKESHKSTLGITELPIETGAKVTDHAYVEPKELEYTIADGNAAATYNTLVQFQESRVPFTIVSGLFVYKDMLIKELSAERDTKNSRILSGSVSFRQVILVSTAYAQGEGKNEAGKAGGDKSTKSSADAKRAANQTTADKTAGTVTRGDQSSKAVEPARNQSILSRMTK